MKIKLTGGDEWLGVEGGGDQRLGLGNNRDGGADWEVGASNSESVDGVSDIVDSLEKTVGINVLVGASGHTEGIAGLKNQTDVKFVPGLGSLSTSVRAEGPPACPKENCPNSS